MENKVSESWQKRIESDDLFRREFNLLLREVRSHSLSNIEFFRGGENEKYAKFETAFRTLIQHIDRGIEPAIERLISISHQYDFDPDLPANGYRSFVKIIRKCCFKILQLCRAISRNRESMFFRGGHYGRELTAYVTTLGQLRACIYYLDKLTHYCEEGALFPDEEKMTADKFRESEMMMFEVESLRQECFYGRCLGFQYCDSMIKPLVGVCLFMASFSDGYLSENSSTVMRVANSLLGGGRYIIDPELRGEKIVEVTRNCDINFCKAFWATNENDVMHTLPLFVCPPVQIDKVITLPPEPLDMPLVHLVEETIRITPPNAHSGPGPVSCRLISYELREGQETWKAHGARPTHSNPTKVHPRADGLVIHLHGGGFVAQSSASHEVYLRHWAKQLRVPIFSVDYSLAPENPFPRGLEDCLYAYCWAVKNCKTLGSMGNRIAVVGDSAGGNLAIALSMKAAQYGIRVPDGIQTTYACTMIRYSPSASRLMSLMDPLLPIGILSRCLAAYMGMTETTGINAPMHGSITKQTLYEFDERATNMSAATSEENISEVSSKMPNNKQVSIDKLSCENLEQVSEAFTKSGRVLTKTQSDICDGVKEINVGEGLIRKTTVEKQVSFSDSSTNEKNHGFVQKHKPTNSMDSGFVDVEKENNASNNQESFQIKHTKTRQDEGLGRSPPETKSILKAEEHKPSVQTGSKGKNSLKPNLRLNLADQQCNKSGQKGTNGSHHLGKSLSTPSFPVSETSHMPTSSGSVYLPTEQGSPDQYYTLPDEISPGKEELSFAQTRHYAQSPMALQFKDLAATTNPYISPVMAEDELLVGLPPIYFVCCHLDPMLDDSITLAKRLRDLGNEVHLDVLEDLPHGFLNFILVSQEAKQGSDLCVTRIKDILTPEDAGIFDVVDLM